MRKLRALNHPGYAGNVLRWLLPALLPAIVFAWVVYRTDREREPFLVVAGSFVLGMLAAGGAFFLEARAARWTGLDVQTSVAGDSGALLFLFAFVAPVREAAKVAACWPAFRSRFFDEPYDGIVYASSSALGFVAVENALVLRAHPEAIWLARAGLAFPAHVFFAAAWGYALGRAKQHKKPGASFPLAWLGATMAHGLYIHFVYGRGSGALVAAAPLLLAMAVVVVFAARDLRMRGDRASRTPGSDPYASRLSRVSIEFMARPSLSEVRREFVRQNRPLMLRWVVFGAFVTLGAMLLGVAAAIAFGHWARVDFASVDEQDVSTAGPVALLGAGLLAAFPLSGYLVAKASNLPSLLEPALAAALALVVTLVVVGLAAPLALIFGLALAPVAWGLACAGAWVGRPAE